MALVSIVRTVQKSETLSGWALLTLRDVLTSLATKIETLDVGAKSFCASGRLTPTPLRRFGIQLSQFHPIC